MWDHLREFDWLLVGSSFVLFAIGMLALHSSSLARGDFGNFEKQLIFGGIGISCMFIVSFFDYRLLRNDSLLILGLYGIGVAALVGLLLFAPETRGVKSWYKIGDISVDPIEYMKLILVILMAKYLSLRHFELYRIRHIVITGAYFSVPMFLIALQPNLGPVLVLFALWVFMLLVSGIRIRHFLAILTVVVLIFALGWTFFLLDYQKARILSFVEPELNPLTIGWSQLQAKIAIGNGGMLGQGYSQGTQTQYGFLSEPQTDFIFAALAEEFGLLGISVLLFFLILFVWRIFKIGAQAQTNFARLFAIGFAVLLIVQTFINIGMNLGLLPIIGLPLPLVSYGGASLIFTYIGLGVLLSIKTH
ncbi:MAG TPA: FtsW/RodA/SpoVE family cell cycle protein [Candidatus Paceibacterota bacterium]|nr:FtsW/RodA/SpoVE family cell cycle protein [Candidatus Paceibacterota bacterium]